MKNPLLGLSACYYSMLNSNDPVVGAIAVTAAGVAIEATLGPVNY